MIREVYSYIKKYPILLLILFFGWLVNLSLVLPINAHLGHDTYWHVALINVAFDTIPPRVPIFVGETLQGYNYLLDLFMYFVTIIGIPAVYVYLIVFPLIYLTALTVLSIYFAKEYNKSIYFVAPFTFFTFLATPFSYLLSYYRRGSLFFGYNYPATMQSSTALTNIAYAFTIILIFIALIMLQKKQLNTRNVCILGILIALAFGVKFYGGCILIFLSGIYLFIKLIQEKKIMPFLKHSVVILIAAVISIIMFYDPFSSVKTGAIFGFYPLATVHPFIEDPDAFYIPYFVQARYALSEAGGFSPRLIFIELFTIFIYIIYNAGTRIIGFMSIIKKILTKNLSTLEISLLITIFFSAFMSMFFVQKGGDWWNTVQFFGYALFFLNIFAAQSIYEFSKKGKRVTMGIMLVVIILTLPLNIELVAKAALHIGKPGDISKSELEALNYLKHKDQGIVFALPITYESSYIAALSAQQVYFANENVLSNIGIDYEERKKKLEDNNCEVFGQIDYVYYRKDYKGNYLKKCTQNVRRFTKDFENEEVVILEKI